MSKDLQDLFVRRPEHRACAITRGSCRVRASYADLDGCLDEEINSKTHFISAIFGHKGKWFIYDFKYDRENKTLTIIEVSSKPKNYPYEHCRFRIVSNRNGELQNRRALHAYDVLRLFRRSPEFGSFCWCFDYIYVDPDTNTLCIWSN